MEQMVVSLRVPPHRTGQGEISDNVGELRQVCVLQLFPSCRTTTRNLHPFSHMFLKIRVKFFRYYSKPIKDGVIPTTM